MKPVHYAEVEAVNSFVRDAHELDAMLMEMSHQPHLGYASLTPEDLCAAQSSAAWEMDAYTLDPFCYAYAM